MNIDDLWRDIEEMEENHMTENDKKGMSNLITIAQMYDEDKNKCQILIDKFRDEYGIKINII